MASEKEGGRGPPASSSVANIIKLDKKIAGLLERENRLEKERNNKGAHQD